jgi:hypothetical protein
MTENRYDNRKLREEEEEEEEEAAGGNRFSTYLAESAWQTPTQ